MIVIIVSPSLFGGMYQVYACWPDSHTPEHASLPLRAVRDYWNDLCLYTWGLKVPRNQQPPGAALTSDWKVLMIKPQQSCPLGGIAPLCLPESPGGFNSSCPVRHLPANAPILASLLCVSQTLSPTSIFGINSQINHYLSNP